MKIVLSDSGLHLTFAPLSLTRPVADLRMGIFTNTERWKLCDPSCKIFYETESYLTEKFASTSDADLYVNGALIPTKELASWILNLPENGVFKTNGVVLAKKGNATVDCHWSGEEPLVLSKRWHLFQYNDRALKSDFAWITAGRTSQPLSKSNTVIGELSQLFLEEGAVVEASILNTKTGPIYVGKNAEIMEGSIVRGGLAMNEDSALKLGAKIYGAVTLGPNCKVGGEVNNAIFQAFSNKGHDGFVGNSLIGEWCNLGADTNTSNLKNNYSNVTTYSYESQTEEQTDVQFMGVTMGDHSKCGINTMFNTATVVGVSCNVYGGDFPEKFIPSFSWGGINPVPFKFEKAIEYANNMMQRRGLKLTASEQNIMRHINSEK